MKTCWSSYLILIKVINKGPMRLRAFKGLPKERRNPSLFLCTPIRLQWQRARGILSCTRSRDKSREEEDAEKLNREWRIIAVRHILRCRLSSPITSVSSLLPVNVFFFFLGRFFCCCFLIYSFTMKKRCIWFDL